MAADVQASLTTGPDEGPSAEAIEAQLQTRFQTKASHSIEEHEGVENVGSVPKQFVATDLLSKDIAPTVADGLTSAADLDRFGRTEADRAKVMREHEELLRDPEFQTGQAEAAARALARDEERTELYEYRRGEALNNFIEAEDTYAEALAWGQADYSTRCEIVQQVYRDIGYDEEEIQYFTNELDAIYAQARGEQEQAEATAVHAQLMVRAGVERFAAAQEFCQARGLDLNAPETRALIANLEGVAIDAGADPSRLGGANYAAALAGAEDVIRQGVEADNEARLKHQIFFADDTSIANGLKVLGPSGFQSVVETPQFAPRAFDPNRLDRVMARRTGETHDEVRASVLGDTAAKREYTDVQKVGQEAFAKFAAQRQELEGGRH